MKRIELNGTHYTRPDETYSGNTPKLIRIIQSGYCDAHRCSDISCGSCIFAESKLKAFAEALATNLINIEELS